MIYDHEIVDIVKNIYSNKLANKMIVRKIPNTNLKTYGNIQYNDLLYTYIMADISPKTHSTAGAVVLNLKADWLREIMSPSMNNATDTMKDDVSLNNIIVLDKDGIIISSPSQDMFLKDISETANVKKILTSSKSSDSFSTKIDGSRYLVTYVTSSQLDWRFVSLTPYKAAISPIDQFATSTLLLCLVVILIGLVLTFTLSNKIYTPIGSLIHNVTKSIGKDNNTKADKDELDFLSTTFMQMLAKSNELDAIKRKDFKIIKNEYLKDILLQNKKDNPQNKNYDDFDPAKLSISFDKHSFLLLLRIDHYADFSNKYNDIERALYKFALSNIAGEQLQTYYPHEIVDMGNDYLVAIMNCEAHHTNNDIYKTLTPVIQQIQAYVKHHFEISFSVTFGYVINNISNIDSMYKSTLNLSMYRLIYGHESVLVPEITEKISAEEFKYPFTKEKLLLDSLKLGKIDQVLKEYNSIISAITCYPYENIISSFTYLYFNTYNSMYPIMEKFSNTQPFIFNYSTINFATYETLEEINEVYLQMFHHIVNTLNKSKPKKSDSLVDNITAVIQKRYADNHLCLSVVADELGMSQVYIRRIFKEVTGKSVADYITEFRLNKVKQQLDAGNTNINMILQSVGMEKSNYFYTTFKKYFGVSLSVYKAEVSTKNGDDTDIKED
jgi:AraC-like DNA-binding protein